MKMILDVTESTKLQIIIVLASENEMRRGELVLLTWEAIDLK